MLKTDVYLCVGAHHEQTGLNTIDTNMTGWVATSAIEVSDLLRPRLVVKKLVVGLLHNLRNIGRQGENKSERFKCNLVIIQSRYCSDRLTL